MALRNAGWPLDPEGDPLSGAVRIRRQEMERAADQRLQWRGVVPRLAPRGAACSRAPAGGRVATALEVDPHSKLDVPRRSDGCDLPEVRAGDRRRRIAEVRVVQ